MRDENEGDGGEFALELGLGWEGQMGCIYRRLYLMVRPTIDPSNSQ